MRFYIFLQLFVTSMCNFNTKYFAALLHVHFVFCFVAVYFSCVYDLCSNIQKNYSHQIHFSRFVEITKTPKALLKGLGRPLCW